MTRVVLRVPLLLEDLRPGGAVVGVERGRQGLVAPLGLVAKASIM